MTEKSLTQKEDSQIDQVILERVLLTGDLSGLDPKQRVIYYMETCKSLGLNPLTKPFDYIVLNEKLTLYPGKTAAAQLRGVKGISFTKLEIDVIDGELMETIVYGQDSKGRADVDIGTVSIKGLNSSNYANARMKSVTKAKRRLTLSLAGLGMVDETELETIPDVKHVQVDHTTGEVIEGEIVEEKEPNPYDDRPWSPELLMKYLFSSALVFEGIEQPVSYEKDEFLMRKIQAIKNKRGNNTIPAPTEQELGMIAAAMEYGLKQFTRLTKKESLDAARHKLLSVIWGKPSVLALTPGRALVMQRWLDWHKDEESGEWIISGLAEEEMEALYDMIKDQEKAQDEAAEGLPHEDH
jgi:hypothetical protein